MRCLVGAAMEPPLRVTLRPLLVNATARHVTSLSTPPLACLIAKGWTAQRAALAPLRSFAPSAALLQLRLHLRSQGNHCRICCIGREGV